jgi:hypothetical protein
LTAVVSAPCGGRGTSQPKRLRRRRAASTDKWARRPRLTRIGRQARSTRALRLNDFDCMALELAQASTRPINRGTFGTSRGQHVNAVYVNFPECLEGAVTSEIRGIRAAPWWRSGYGTGPSRLEPTSPISEPLLVIAGSVPPWWAPLPFAPLIAQALSPAPWGVIRCCTRRCLALRTQSSLGGQAPRIGDSRLAESGNTIDAADEQQAFLGVVVCIGPARHLWPAFDRMKS